MKKLSILIFLFCLFIGTIAYSVDVFIFHESTAPILIVGMFALIGTVFAIINEVPVN